jgi:hypothetical protein
MDELKLKEAYASLVKAGDNQAIAQLMVEYIEPEHIATDFISMLLNTRSLNAGDSIVKKIRKGIKVHTLVNYGTASL